MRCEQNQKETERRETGKITAENVTGQIVRGGDVLASRSPKHLFKMTKLRDV